jgi:hypothetical protein
MTYPKKDPDGRLSVQEIIKRSPTTALFGKDWKHVYAAIHHLLQGNEYRSFRTGNTLFLLKILQPSVGELFVFSADKYQDLLKHFKELAQALIKANYTQVIGVTDDTETIQAVKKMGFPHTIERVGNPVGKLKQQYQIIVNLSSANS